MSGKLHYSVRLPILLKVPRDVRQISNGISIRRLSLTFQKLELRNFECTKDRQCFVLFLLSRNYLLSFLLITQFGSEIFLLRLYTNAFLKGEKLFCIFLLSFSHVEIVHNSRLHRHNPTYFCFTRFSLIYMYNIFIRNTKSLESRSLYLY